MNKKQTINFSYSIVAISIIVAASTIAFFLYPAEVKKQQTAEGQQDSELVFEQVKFEYEQHQRSIDGSSNRYLDAVR